MKKVPTNIRSRGKFSSYTDPGTGEYKILKFMEAGENGESLYSLFKYGSKKTFGIIDSVVTEDFMVLYVKPKGDFKKRAIQFHQNDFALTNVANIY